MNFWQIIKVWGAMMVRRLQKMVQWFALRTDRGLVFNEEVSEQPLQLRSRNGSWKMVNASTKSLRQEAK